MIIQSNIALSLIIFSNYYFMDSGRYDTKSYVPYTTNLIMTNNDMYDTNDIMEQILKNEIEKDK